MATPKFDPSAAAQPGSGIFGLPFTKKDARIILIPVPFDATTSYRGGTMYGPTLIFNASMQVDLLDRRLGRVYEQGIFMLDEVVRIRELCEEATKLGEDILENGGPEEGNEEDAKDLAEINKISEEVNRYVKAEAAKVLRDGKIPGVVGGEHSVPFGAIEASAEKHGEIGILHIDAHMDLRPAFEGFQWSHASIMHNVLTRIPGVKKLVQVGIRDFGENELDFAKSQGNRVVVHFDDANAERLMNGETWPALCKEFIAALPQKVYVSFDIDGLDPALCPHTGTPVPGGLSFHQASMLLEALKNSGKTIVGFDLVEVAPSSDPAADWDGNVGARILYKLCGIA
jgi:agmatinase